MTTPTTSEPDIASAPGSPEPIRRTVRVKCPVDHAFAVFTARLDLWWPPSHRRLGSATDRSRLVMEPMVGGRFYERGPSGQEARLGEVVRWEPPRRVTYTWYPGAISAPTEVDVQFAADGEHTVVDVVHAEGDSALGAEWPARAERFRHAWSEVLPAFVRYADTAEGGETA